MILGPLSKQQPSSLLILDHNVEQASIYKLLGVIINNSLKWDNHITAVTSGFSRNLNAREYLRLTWSVSTKLLSDL